MKSIVTSVIYLIEPPYTEPYVRWCERTGASHLLLLDSYFGPVPHILQAGMQGLFLNQNKNGEAGFLTLLFHQRGKCSSYEPKKRDYV